MRQIYLSGKNEKDKFFIVDDEDYDRLKQYKFFQWKNTYCVHIFMKKKRIPVARLILNESKDVIINYKNGNRLDLRKENLVAHERMIIKEKDNLLYLKFFDGKMAVIDKKFKFLIDEYPWYLTKRGYLRRSDNNTFFHRIVLNPPIGFDCDHINGNTSDNREENLRIVSKSQNMMNKRKIIAGDSAYKGIYKDRNLWVSSICKNRKSFYLGLYIKEEDAAIVYNKAARLLFGEFARLNDIEDVPFVLTTSGRKIDEEYLKTILPINQ